MEQEELMRVCKAAEFLYNRFSLTGLVQDDFSKVVSGGELKDATDDSVFCIKIDDSLQSIFCICNSYIVRKGRQYYETSEESFAELGVSKIDTTLTSDIAFSIMRILKDNGIDKYSSVDDELLDPEFKDKLKDLESRHNYSKAFDCEIKNKLTTAATNTELKALLALADYPSDLGGRIYDYAQENHTFFLKAFRDFDVIDNRIIIPLSPTDKYELRKKCRSEGEEYPENMNAIVISKNPLDYFYASYGNAFQSCFSLNSDYSYWYGYLPNVMAKECFMLYGTSGAVLKTGVISGNKFHSPQMFWRSWGYADAKRNLLIDKRYHGDTKVGRLVTDFCVSLLVSKFNALDFCARDSLRSLFGQGQEIAKIHNNYDLFFYADSLKYSRDGEEVKFKYGNGDRNVRGEYRPDWMSRYSSFKKYAETVATLKDLNPYKKAVVQCGVLFNPKSCPITNLYISEDESQHVYAKYFTSPVKSLACITYVDGFPFVEYATESCDCTHFWITKDSNFSKNGFCNGKLLISLLTNCYCKNVSLKSLKEHIKGYIKETPYDAIFLKVIEGDKITCQVFKNKKQEGGDESR